MVECFEYILMNTIHGDYMMRQREKDNDANNLCVLRLISLIEWEKIMFTERVGWYNCKRKSGHKEKHDHDLFS